MYVAMWFEFPTTILSNVSKYKKKIAILKLDAYARKV
jgi:hypothetical protein